MPGHHGGDLDGKKGRQSRIPGVLVTRGAPPTREQRVLSRSEVMRMEVSSPDADAIARVKCQATAAALPGLPFFPWKVFLHLPKKDD